jgi:multisubunit Na+/H+ antiporter MnhG subunit
MARGYARSREKDEAARAALVPLAPGERPWPIVVSAVLAALFAILNLALILAGWEVDGERPVAGGLVFCAVMFAAAVGLWRLKYWAVLGFEVLLGVTFIGALLSLLRAGDAWGAVLALVVMALTGPLFYVLIRQMARIQMPKTAKSKPDEQRLR